MDSALYSPHLTTIIIDEKKKTIESGKKNKNLIAQKKSLLSTAGSFF